MLLFANMIERKYLQSNITFIIIPLPEKSYRNLQKFQGFQDSNTIYQTFRPSSDYSYWLWTLKDVQW